MNRRTALRAAAALTALAGLTAAAGCGSGTAPAAGNTPMAVPATPAGAAEAVFVVKGGRVVSGPRTVTAKLGSTVVIQVTTDAPDELHVHGYDKEAQTAGGVARVSFTAGISGIFDVELHHANVLLCELQVR